MENQTTKLNRGNKAPEFKLIEADGEDFSLDASRKEGISQLLIFIHDTGCTACAHAVSEIQQHTAQLDDRGLRPVVISPKPEDYNKELKQTLKLKLPVVSDDGTVAEQYGLIEENKFVPTLMIVDRHGDIVWSYGCQCEEPADWPTMEYIFRHMVMARGV